MKGYFKKLWKDERGMGTVEIVIITAMLVGLALLFRDQIVTFLNNILAKTFENGNGFFD